MTSAAENPYAERMRQILHVPVTALRVAGAQHGYQHLTATLADGWRDRVPLHQLHQLHQLHPLLVHVCLFGASYAGQLRAAARAALAA